MANEEAKYEGKSCNNTLLHWLAHAQMKGKKYSVELFSLLHCRIFFLSHLSVNPALFTQSGSFQMLLAMVRHFQHLFRIPRLEGVYPTMTVLNQQIEHYKNVLTRLKEMFHLGK